ncbi:hypothetical protein KHP62_07665 [Rhodobacteraceae bacterium NNCM2]|nr:hypothetical protein [Coraliihabitans acroporae]
MRIALTAAVALISTGAAAESLQEALTGRWALMPDSQAQTDAENVAAAERLCAEEGASNDRFYLTVDGKQNTLTTLDGDGAEVAFAFDPEVAGTRLEDGRLFLAFSVEGVRTHELTFWKMTIDGAEYNLVEMTGPPSPVGLYLKCR